MIQNIVRHVSGIEVYGVFSICLFFLCFTGVLLWAWRLKRPYLDTMAALPLDQDQDTENGKSQP